ncbi:hypothetical protein BaRGS_00008319 [Batillaria attramentaria]|uniref:Major facilitator superfamily (MFS) profile domain-containing protein n=1 Tax=Batillaria attramentaria TaxID=370345 RepID=A0ABD0LMZ2_9CAEN|nr:hypothetical protein BaRGS_028648 [Batillaria attramentaria]
MTQEEKKTESPTTFTSSPDIDPDDDLDKLVSSVGGHGCFQILVWSVGFGTKASVAGVFLYMSFAGATPDWWCLLGNPAENGSDITNDSVSGRWNGTDLLKSCYVNGSRCPAYRFDKSMRTVVGEWSLVCDQKWVSSTITSVQMAGVLLGALVAGQAADIWGRKKTSILMLIGQVLFSLVNAFSPDWIVFIITRCGAGFCGGGYLVPYFALTMEFTDINWRTVLGAIPAWPIGASLLALVAWLLHDWQYIGIYVAAFTVPFLVAWFFMPESVRWLLVHGRVEEAQAILCRAARQNGKPQPDATRTRALASAEASKARADRTYTFLDLFRTGALARRSFLLFFVWFSSGAVFYFLAFGAENLSGNLYLNLFLLSIVDAPAQLISAYLNNKIGRRWTAFALYMLAGVTSVAVIITKALDVSGSVVNGLVIFSKLAMGGGWAAVLVFSAENFPTVVRNIGYGACNTASRVGAILAPQLVFLYTTSPAVPYAIVAALMVLSSLAFLKIRETNAKALEDVIETRDKAVHETHAAGDTQDEKF